MMHLYFIVSTLWSVCMVTCYGSYMGGRLMVGGNKALSEDRLATGHGRSQVMGGRKRREWTGGEAEGWRGYDNHLMSLQVI